MQVKSVLLCVPACHRADDMQVEFVMLDPYVRLPLKHDGKGTFSVQFKVWEAKIFHVLGFGPMCGCL